MRATPGWSPTRMMGVHRAISLFTSLPSSAWPRLLLSGMSQPRSDRRLRTVSSSSALSSAAVSVSSTGCGVAFGANRPYQADTANSGSPASAVVGMVGRAALRFAVPVA